MTPRKLIFKGEGINLKTGSPISFTLRSDMSDKALRLVGKNVRISSLRRPSCPFNMIAERNRAIDQTKSVRLNNTPNLDGNRWVSRKQTLEEIERISR